MKSKKVLLYTFLAVMFYFIAFHRIDSFPIQTWDESRLAANAIEMYQNNKLLVTHYNNEPDLWNTKPPLMIWLQYISLHIFGINELAIRFPAILALLGICFSLIYFSRKIFKMADIGILASFVLITFPGFNEFHGSRTGDYDILLILFTSLFCFWYYCYLTEKKARYLYLFALAVVFAVYTKSISGLMFLPGLLLFTFFVPKGLHIFKRKEFYLASLLIIVGISLFYLTRECAASGYLKAVWENELGGRYLSTIEEHKHPFYFYLEFFFRKTFPWYIALILGSILLHKKFKKESFLLFLAICISSFFIIISAAETKLMWYDLPIYPFLALLIGYYLFSFLQFLKAKLPNNVLANAIIFLLFCYPSYKIIYRNQILQFGNDIAHFLKRNESHYQQTKKFTLCNVGYRPETVFYQAKLNSQGYHVSVKDISQVDVGEIIYYYNPKILGYAKELYVLKNDSVINSISKIEIISKRN